MRTSGGIGRLRNMKPTLIALLMCLSLSAVHAAETITLPVKRTAYEKVWEVALVDKLRADKVGNVFDEQRLDFGRADVVTEKEVYEVDRYNKFHQGIGQTLHYSMVLKKPPVLALMLDKTKIDPAKTAFIEKLCKHYKIRLVLLKAEKKEDK